MYIVKEDLSTNTEYGLPEQLRITAITINGEGKSVLVDWKKVVVSPTGKIVETLESGQYVKTDEGETQDYTAFQTSDVGQDIVQYLTNEYLQATQASRISMTKKSK